MKKEEVTQSSTDGSLVGKMRVTTSMKKKVWVKEFFFNLYHLGRIALSLTLIILVFQTDLSSISLSSGYQRIQEIITLWSKNVIVDIVTVNTFNCPQGYEPYTSAQWPGTREGCMCNVKLNTYDYTHVLQGRCTNKLIEAGCIKVPEQKPISFSFWKPEHLICLKRLRGVNFYSNLSSLREITKVCGAGTPFEMRSLNISECPITEISNLSSTFSNVLPDIGFSYSRESSFPIIDIKMSEFSFCLQYNLSNISPNRFKNYVLENIEISNCSEANDPRVKEIDSITEKTLFLNNERIYDIIENKLPVYPRPSDLYTYKLGTVEYPSWASECRNSEHFNLLVAREVFEFQEATEKSKVCIMISVLLGIIWGILFSIYFLIKRILELRNKRIFGVTFFPDHMILESENPNIISNKLQLSFSNELTLFFLEICLAIGLLINLGIQYNFTSTIEKWLRNSFHCQGDSDYLKVWIEEGYVSNLQTVIRKYLICIICVIVVVCFDIIFLFWRFNKGDLAHQNISDLFYSFDDGDQSDENISEKNENGNDQDEEFEDKNQKEFFDDGYDMSVLARENTGPIDLGKHSPSIISGTSRNRKPKNKNLKSRAEGRAHETNNQTEESLVNLNDEREERFDVEFNRISLDSHELKKSKKIGRKKHKKSVALSDLFDQ